jgi:hypothetical protein
LIITGAEEQEVEAFKAQMKKTFDMRDLGLLNFGRLTAPRGFWSSGEWVVATLPILQWRNS